MHVMRSLVLGLALLTGCAAVPPPIATAGSKQARARECTRSDQCIVVPRSCCGMCGAPTSDDARAVARGAASADPSCRHTGCPDCVQPPDPRLTAYCTLAGHCRLLDLTRGPLAHCTTDAECELHPLGCCECGSPAWIATTGRGWRAYSDRVCEPLSACPACAGRPPPPAAVCRANRCEVGP